MLTPEELEALAGRVDAFVTPAREFHPMPWLEPGEVRNLIHTAQHRQEGAEAWEGNFQVAFNEWDRALREKNQAEARLKELEANLADIRGRCDE